MYESVCDKKTLFSACVIAKESQLVIRPNGINIINPLFHK